MPPKPKPEQQQQQQQQQQEPIITEEYFTDDWELAALDGECNRCAETKQKVQLFKVDYNNKKKQYLDDKAQLDERQRKIATVEANHQVHAQGMQIATENARHLEERLRQQQDAHDEVVRLFHIEKTQLRQQQEKVIADNEAIARENVKLQAAKEQIENDRNDIIKERTALRISNQELDDRFAEISRRTAELDGLEQKALFLEEQRKAFECTKQDSLVYAQNMRELADERQKLAQVFLQSERSRNELEFANIRAQLEADRVKLTDEQQKCIDDGKKKDKKVVNIKKQMDKINAQSKAKELRIQELNGIITTKTAALDAKQQELDAKQQELDAKQQELDAKNATSSPPATTPPAATPPAA